MMKEYYRAGVNTYLENRTAQQEQQEALKRAYETLSLSESTETEGLEALRALRAEIDAEASRLEQEAALLEEGRRSLEQSLDSEIRALENSRVLLAKKEMDHFQQSFSDAKRACERSIQEYQQLKNLLQEDFPASPEMRAEILSQSYAESNRLQVEAQPVQFLENLPPECRSAVVAYTGEEGPGCYHAINPILRGQVDRSSVSPETVQSFRHLHAFLNDQRTTAPITVYRGVGSQVKMVRSNGTTQSLADFSDEELVGKLLTDAAFVSTSTKEESILNGNTVLVLNLPAGTRGAYVGDISQMQHHEKEFLMDCGQAFRVTRVEHRNRIRYIYADSKLTGKLN